MKGPGPDVLVINAAHEEEQHADGVALLVTVHGLSLVTGSAALSQAKEVVRLVEELGRCGIPSADVGLVSVHAEQSSGVLGKSSAAVYRLRVRCPQLERLPDALGVVTSAKNARLDELVWTYPESAEQEARWLRLAIAAANARADAAARALGASIVGVHHFSEQRLDAGERRSSGPEYTMARRATPLQLGFELTQQRRAGVRVTIQYRVEGYAPPADR